MSDKKPVRTSEAGSPERKSSEQFLPVANQKEEAMSNTRTSRHADHSSPVADFRADGVPFPSPHSPNKKTDRSMKIYIDMFNRGKARAIQSGDTEPNDADLQSLSEQAGASAREVAQENYDPKKNPHDAIRETEFEKHLTDRKETEQGEKHAATFVREKENVLARLYGLLKKPSASPYILYGATSLMALSLLPTIFDAFFSTFEDELLAWGISLLCGVFAGLFVSFSILGAVQATGERTALNWGGLIGGIVVAVGFAGLRLADVEGVSQIIFCLALTFLEIGIVVMLEFVATGERASFRRWSEQRQTQDRAEAELNAALHDHHRWKAMLAVHEEAIQLHLSYVEEKTVRHFTVDQLESNAVKSIRDGYFDGISINRGHVFGITPERDRS